MGDSEVVVRFEVCNSDEGKDLPPGGYEAGRSGWDSISTTYCPVSADFGSKRSVVERNCTSHEAGTVF